MEGEKVTADSFPWICLVESTGLSKRKVAKLSVFSLEFLRFGRLAGHGLPSLSGSKGNSCGKIFFSCTSMYICFFLALCGILLRRTVQTVSKNKDFTYWFHMRQCDLIIISTWNMAFVSNYPDFPFYLAKLLIPTVSGYHSNPEGFLYPRHKSL